MLEEMVKHAQIISKEAALKEIGETLANAFIAEKLPRSFAAIKNRVSDLERIQSQRQFSFALVDFILWLNGERSLKQEVPHAKTFRDPFILLKYLPYDQFTMQIEGRIIKFWPASMKFQGISGKRSEVEAWLRRVDQKQFAIEMYICHEGLPCKLNWVDEEGNASIKLYDGYQVKPLSEFLSKP